MVLASFVFMHRMSELVSVQSAGGLLEDIEDPDAPEGPDQRDLLPAGVAAFRISGPLFFAAADRLDEVLDLTPKRLRVFILRMRLVPMIDASGAHALKQFLERCRKNGTAVIFSGVQPQPHEVLISQGVANADNLLGFAEDFDTALDWARQAVASQA